MGVNVTPRKGVIIVAGVSLHIWSELYTTVFTVIHVVSYTSRYETLCQVPGSSNSLQSHSLTPLLFLMLIPAPLPTRHCRVSV